MAQKKLMLLGGLRYLLPVIDVAHRLGIHVITVDYLPDNIAHKYSDEYHNVSIIDKDAVLELAQKLQIDGIMSYAVDPGVVTAAYVAEQMGLPFQCSYEAACILQDKARFRAFLTENHFNVPVAKGYTSIEKALDDVDMFNWPVIVKPVDSAGSKGVTKVVEKSQLRGAIEFALSESHCGSFIIEDFLEKDGFSAGSESFAVDGKLVYNGFYDQYFDNNAENPFTPSAECWPSVMNSEYLDEVKSELQRLFNLLDVRTGLFNIEFRHCKNGKTYLMEVSPRAGGNRLAEMLNYAADVDIIEAETRKAVGLDIKNIHEPNYRGHFAILVIHNEKKGTYTNIQIDKSIEPSIIETEIRVKEGDYISTFSGANAAIGTLFMKFHSRKELEDIIGNSKDWLIINLK